MLNVNMLSFVMLNVIMISFVMLNVIMLSVAMLDVVMLSVVAPSVRFLILFFFLQTEQQRKNKYGLAFASFC
jgi:hypothetical protein